MKKSILCKKIAGITAASAICIISAIPCFSCPQKTNIKFSSINEYIKSLADEKINNLKKKIGSYCINFPEYNTSESIIIFSEMENTEKINYTNTENSNKLPECYSEFISKTVELTNAERAKYGLEPLILNENLCKAAQEHVEDMYSNNYFSHESLSGATVKDRINRYSNGFSFYAENIAYGQTTPEEVVKDWMNSEGHRANILGNYTQIGIGFYGNYWCQDFTR